MNDGIILIGAGTQGARTINHEFQPFLRIDGRTCIEIVLDEVTRTDNDFPVFIWGPEKTLKEVLSPIVSREKDRRAIQIVPERSNPIESLICTCLESSLSSDRLGNGDWSAQMAAAAEHNPGLRIFYLPADIPLASHKEMDFFIKNAEPDQDLLWGWSLRNGFEAVMKVLQNDRTNIDMSRTKINFSRFIVNDRLEEARFNNFYCGRPLRIDPNLFLFIHQIYQNRNLINKEDRTGEVGKKIDLRNFLRLLEAYRRYVRTRRTGSGTRASVYAYRILMTYFHSLGLEGKNFRFIGALVRSVGLIDRRPSASYIDKSFAEESVQKLTGNRIGMYFSDIIGPLIDIDNEYEYEFVKAHFGRLREAIDDYYATYGIRRLS
jgi:hypothetical protein